MIMMTKKRTSALANIKLLIVVPVVGLVFLAISAYREIPIVSDKQAVPITLDKELSSSGLISSPSKVSPDLSGKSLNQAASSASRSAATSAPTPPPPPPPSGLREENGNSKEEVAENVDITPFVVVEEMPMFPGGENELLRYIAEHTNYPETAKVNNIQGRVIIRFCVTDKGGISMISVLKGVDPALDEEALRVVSALPAFNPGKQGGKAVPVWFMVPITFTLK
jgi:TonB family protein